MTRLPCGSTGKSTFAPVGLTVRRVSSVRPIPAQPHGLGASVLTPGEKKHGEAHRNRSANWRVSSGSKLLIVVRTQFESDRFPFLMSRKPSRSMRSCPSRPHTRNCRPRHIRHGSCCITANRSDQGADNSSAEGEAEAWGAPPAVRARVRHGTLCALCAHSAHASHPNNGGEQDFPCKLPHLEQLIHMTGAATQMTGGRASRHAR